MSGSLLNGSADSTRVEAYLQQYANGGGSAGDQQRARAALSRLTQARQRPLAAAPYPLWRALGTVGLMTSAFEFGWRIGRTVDQKWLHFSGDVGTAATNAWVTGESWHWREHWTVRPPARRKAASCSRGDTTARTSAWASARGG